jgi:hypothetical protein
MSRSAPARRGARLAVVCAPWIIALASCSPPDEPAAALKPLYCRADCDHCESFASELIDFLPMPPPRARRAPVERSAVNSHEHRALVELRSHEGVPAAGAHVELWQHFTAGEPVRTGTATTDVDGIARIPFDGRGVDCVHAEHAAVGATAQAPRQLRLARPAQDWVVELVLPKGDVVLQRAGVVQIGVAAPDGSPLELSRVAIWRHDFGADEPALAGTGLTDAQGVVRIELDRPAIYAVAASHADHASDSLEYAWYVPRSPRGESRDTALSTDRTFIACDAHLRLGADAPTGLRIPFHEHDLGSEDDLQVTEAPACCRTWSTPEDEAASFLELSGATSDSLATNARRYTRKHADPPAVSRPADELPPPFSSNPSLRRVFDGDSPLDDATHAAVRHR